MSNRNKMFRKNDSYLHITYSLLIIVHILALLAVVAGGIFYASKNVNIWTGLETLWFVVLCLAACLGIFVSWIISACVISYFVDIKLIRNKLYDVNDNHLNNFFE